MKVVNLKFVLNNRPAANGLHLLMLYIFKSGSKSPAYLGTGIYIKESHFNPKGTRESQNWVKRSDLAAKYNIELATIYDHAARVIKFLKDSGRIETTDNRRIKEYIESGDPADLLVYMKKRIQEFEAVENFGRVAQIRVLVNFIEQHYPNTPLTIGTITVQFLRDLEKKLNSEPIKQSTIKNYLSTLRASYNHYHRENEITPHNNPFKIFQLGNPKSQEKGVLYPSNIQTLVDTEPTAAETHAKNVYLLLYFLQGMRVGDLITLKRHQIVDTYDIATGEKNYKVMYQMQKSEKIRILPVPVVANYLIEYYQQLIIDERQNSPDGYFLPFIYRFYPEKKFKTDRANLLTEKGLYYRVFRINKLLNKHFKALCKKLGLPELTMHTSRHSLATHLYEKTKDLRIVQKSMAHSSILTTEKYLHDYTSSNLAGNVYEDYKKS